MTQLTADFERQRFYCFYLHYCNDEEAQAKATLEVCVQINAVINAEEIAA